MVSKSWSDSRNVSSWRKGKNSLWIGQITKPPLRAPRSKIVSGAPLAAFSGAKNRRSIMRLSLSSKLGIGISRKLIMRPPLGCRPFAKAVYAECGIKHIGLLSNYQRAKSQLLGRCISHRKSLRKLWRNFIMNLA